MVKIQLNKISSRSPARFLRFLIRFPVLPPALAAAVIYFFHLAHWPYLWRLALVIPVVALGYGAGVILERLVRRRLERPVSLGPELLISCLAAGSLLLLPEAFFGTSLSTGIVLTLLAWLVIQFLFKQAGGFYTAFLGLFIFLIVQYSFHVLHLEERLVLRTIAYLRKSEVAEKIRGQYRWETIGDRRLLFKQNRPLLEMSIPEDDLFFFNPLDLDLDYRYSLAGLPLAVLAANASKPTVPPVLVLFELSPEDGRDAAALAPVVKRLLGHMENASMISELAYRGAREYQSPVSKLEYEGIFWAYTETSTTRNMQAGIYLFRKGARRFMLFIREPVFRGFRHHPDVLFMLGNLKILPDN